MKVNTRVLAILYQGKMDHGAKWTNLGLVTLNVNNKKSISSILNLMSVLSSAHQNTLESYPLATVRLPVTSQ